MNIPPVQVNRVIGAINVAAGVGIGAVVAHQALTKDVPTKRTVQLGFGALGAAALGVVSMVPQSSKLLTPALGAAILGLGAFMGIGFTNE